MERLGNGVYSFQEAARLTGLRPQRAREWFLGRTGEDARKAVFRGDYRSVLGDHAVSFHDLVELFVAGRLREHGVSLQSLRKVHKQLQKDLSTRHPFCRREVLSDGKTVFTLGLDERGKEEMVEVLTRQKVFAEILLPFLKRISYDEATLLARRWLVGEMVVVDPAVCLGKPVVEPVGIATSILASAYEANGRDAEAVAAWYGVHTRHVTVAVEFERSLAS